MQAAIDQRIKKAQRKGIGVYLLSGSITLFLVLGVMLWLFFVKGFNLIIGPNDALKTANVERISGLAWVSNSKIFSLGGNIVVNIYADTFEDATLSINNQSPSTIEVELQPSPATINATAEVNDTRPQSASYLEQSQWHLNGKLIHVGASLHYQAPPGNYQLSLTNAYYKDATESLNLARAQSVDLTLGLQVLNGSISINSVPSGAEVFLDGRSQGVSPISLSVLSGEHKVGIVTDSFASISETIPVKSGFLHTTRNYLLQAKQGLLNIQASPNDGVLLINNIEHALGNLTLSANKTHKIEYKKPGYTSYVKSITLDKNTPTNLKIDLQALYGEVVINTNVPATIKLNGKRIGQGPVTQRLMVLNQNAEVSALGYRTVKQSFTPKANVTSTINIQLLSEFEARRKEGLPLFISSLGIVMKRFKAEAFTLGSPPNETGRRRNEHQVEVDFSRQFWVSEKEITQAQFSAFLSSNQASSANLPMTGVSWLDAAQYCNWLSEQEGLPVFYKFVNGRFAGYNKASLGYRLPTEAEWEWLAKKAKRALSTVYVWGNQEKLRNNLGNFADKSVNGKQLIYFEDYQDGKPGPAEVGSYKADRVGLYDMDGNVSEWVNDYYSNSLPGMTKTHIDYLGHTQGEAWVIKGGNYETGRLRELRAAYREFSSSGKPTLGFRIARYHE